jgi:hypothetical protein
MIQWEDLDLSTILVMATSCPLNPGVLNSEGQPCSFPVRIYVDDALMAALDRTYMEMVLAAIIESIFAVMGEPNMHYDSVRSPCQTMLGLIVDTNTMTLAYQDLTSLNASIF